MRLVRTLRRGRIGIAAPRLLNEDLTLQPSVVALTTSRTAFVGALGLSRLIPNRWQPHWSTHWDHSESRTVDAANGAVYAVRGDAWSRLGGMTERRWMYGEDMDLCRRARALGWDMWYARDATFVHLGSSTVRDHWSDVARAAMIARSEVAHLRTQLPPVQATLTVAFLVLGTALRWVAFAALRKERAAVFRSVLRGYLGALRSREPRSGAADA
jgi:GT2 family glycosyltransferase